MRCSIVNMKNKDVVNVKDGCRLGYVGDVEIDICTAKLISIVIFGRNKCFGLFGREDDLIIEWENIEMIGEDTILVSCCCEDCRKTRPERTWKSWIKKCGIFDN